MKRFLFSIVIGVILSSLVIRAQLPTTITVGIPVKSFDNATTAIANGTAFALPGLASQCTWVTSFTVAPSSITVLIQTSLDNTTYNTLDTSTSTTGETRNVTSAAVFIRARISASSGGSGATVSIICKNGIVSSTLSPTFTNLTVTGTTTLNNITITGTCTGCGGGGTPAGSDTQVQFNDGGAFGGFGSWDGTALEIHDGSFDHDIYISVDSGVGNGSYLYGIDNSSPVLDIEATATAGGSVQGLTVEAYSEASGAGNPTVEAITTQSYQRGTAPIINALQGIRVAKNQVNDGTLVYQNIGLQIDDQHGVSTSNNYAIHIANQGTGANDYAINIDGGKSLFGGQIQLGASSSILGLGEVDITSHTGTSGAAGSPIQITAGDGDMSGAGGNIYLNAGGSSSGTPGDILLQSAGFIQILGAIKFGAAGSIATGTTATNSLILRAYDVDGATYRTFLTLTSNNTPDMTIAPPGGGTVTVQASTYKSSDGSTGVTVTTCTGYKNGLCISGT